jgi:hypothetical protein
MLRTAHSGLDTRHVLRVPAGPPCTGLDLSAQVIRPSGSRNQREDSGLDRRTRPLRAWLVHAWPTASGGRQPDVPVGQDQIEPLRIEVTAGPATRVGVFRMTTIGHDFQESGISADAAHVFWRPGTRTANASGHTRCRCDRQLLLELDDVLPAIAEVVLVYEGYPLPMAEIEQPHLGFVEPAWLPLEFGGTDLVDVSVAQSANHELVQVIVPPTKGGLDHLMQITQVKGPRDDDPSPDLWLNISKRNADLYRVRLDKGHIPKYASRLRHRDEWPRTFGRTPRPRIEFSCGDRNRVTTSPMAARGPERWVGGTRLAASHPGRVCTPVLACCGCRFL